MRRLAAFAVVCCSLCACAEDSTAPGGSNGGAGAVAGIGGAGMGGGGSSGAGGSAGKAGSGGSTGGAAGNAGVGGSSGASGEGGAGASGGNDAGGSGGSGGGGSGGGGGMLPDFCPSDSDELVPTLTNAVEVVPNVPPDDEFAPGWAILEGPVWSDGVLYLSEVANETPPPKGRILKVTPGGDVDVFIPESGSNGLAIDGMGALLAAQHKPSGAIVRFDLGDPEAAAEVLVPGFEGAAFDSPNDLTLRRDGNLYFSDPAWQSPMPPPQSAERAYRYSADKVLSVIEGAPEKPNGITLTPRERELYIAGHGALMRFPLDAAGAVGAGSAFGARAYVDIDGMVVDCAGNLYLADGNAGEIIVLAPNGDELGTIPMVSGVTNLAFGGADRSTLYVTTLGDRPALYQVAVGIPGLPY